ncbi:MAG: pseudouridine synthase, partial [Polyangiales bacterium]
MAPSLAALGCDLRPEAVVYEDEDLIVVDKPAGVPSQAADASHDDDLPARLKRYLAARSGVDASEVYLGVHQRLDKETSGLVLYTLRREANAAIAAQFEGREVRKRYLAAVCSSARLDRGGETRLEHDLVRGRDGRMQVVAAGTPGARKARTRVSVLKRQGERALLRLDCDTGRTHQLRVQLAHVGAPIAGDRLYGGASAMRLLLHAHELELRHPRDGRPLQFEAAAPLEIEHWLAHGGVRASSEPALLTRALELAIEARYRLGRARTSAGPTTAFRLFHGAAEGSEDLAVDIYGGFLVAHFFAEPNAVFEARVLDTLHALGAEGVYLKRHLKQKNELGDARDPRFAPPAPVRGHV